MTILYHYRAKYVFNASLNNAQLSVSLVIYRPDFNILRICINQLNLACGQLNDKRRVKLYLIDNGHTPQWQHLTETFLQEEPLKHLSIEYIARADNPGYGAGNNIAIRQSKAQYHLVLNPDAFVEPDSLRIALDYLLKHPKTVLLAPACFYPDGERQYLCRRNISLLTQFLRSFAPTWLKKRFHQRLWRDEYRDHDYEQPMHNVEFLTGCFMLMQTEAAQRIDGFDEKYFMYVEDADLSRRLLQVGDSVYLPSARIVHQWARLSHRKLKYTLHHLRSSLRYVNKFKHCR